MTPTALGPGAEFDLIRRLTAGLPVPPGVRLASGDDAAWLEGDWVISADLAVEDVHFRREWGTPAEWGGRAVRGALSDLAAMAATPVAVLLSLAGPRADHASGVLAAVGEGARATAVEFGAPPIGGDLARSPGPLLLDVVALGRSSAPLRRNGAARGHDLWVTGQLGGSAAALHALRAGASPAPALRERYLRPRPRLAEAAWLAETGLVRAGLDLSDGLAGDAGHLAAASGVGVEIDPATLPLHPAAVADFGQAAAVDFALAGGEDFELLLAAEPELDAHRGAFERAFPGVGLTRIGRVGAAPPGVWLVTPAGVRRPAGRAFDHFTPPPPGGAAS